MNSQRSIVKGQMSNVKCSMFYASGFTLLELMIVLTILVTVGAVVIPSVALLQKNPKLTNTAEEVIGALTTAQNKTVSSEGNSQYGVFIKTTASPHQYILFKGASYASRETSFDQPFSIPATVEFYTIDGGVGEVVFDKLTGATANVGNISLRLKDAPAQTKIIYISEAGTTSYTAPSIPLDTRTKDSRHVDFNYSRTINTVTENIVLTFNGNFVQTIPVNDNINDGQIDWQGTFNIGGQNQTVVIHTLRLNNPDTRFSVFRDRRLNTKTLAITLSGDATGTLAEYSADGLTTSFDSIYVDNFEWQ